MKTICVNISTYSGDQEIVYIGRPTKFGNPFKIGRDGNRKECLDKYYEYIKNDRQDLIDALPELKGKALACWCKPKDCHGDILVKLIEDDPWELWSKK
jgi:hypothetical protein